MVTKRLAPANPEEELQSSAPKPAGKPEDERVDRRAERCRVIMESAARLFAEHGFDACDMECVAAKVGVAKGTLYLYYTSKQELFLACVDLGMRQMQEAVRSAADKTVDPWEKIELAIRAYLEFFETHPEHVELLIQERANFRDRKRPTYFEYRDANRGTWRQLYADLVAAGRVRNDVPVERILDTVGCLVYGVMFTNHFIGRSTSLDEQYQAILAIVSQGLAGSGGLPPTNRGPA